MRLFKIIAGIAVGTALLAGCSRVFTLDVDQPMTPYQKCMELKRQLIFYSNDPNHNTQWSTPAKRAAILMEYRENDCQELLKNTNHHFWQ